MEKNHLRLKGHPSTRGTMQALTFHMQWKSKVQAATVTLLEESFLSPY